MTLMDIDHDNFGNLDILDNFSETFWMTLLNTLDVLGCFGWLFAIFWCMAGEKGKFFREILPLLNFGWLNESCVHKSQILCISVRFFCIPFASDKYDKQISPIHFFLHFPCLISRTGATWLYYIIKFIVILCSSS